MLIQTLSNFKSVNVIFRENKEYNVKKALKYV